MPRSPRRTVLATLVATLAAALALAACEQVFTSSLAEPLARPAQAPKLADGASLVANLDLLTTSKETAKAALDAVSTLALASGASAEVKEAAVSVALAASGLGSSMMELVPSATELLGGGGDPVALEAKIRDILTGVDTSKVETILLLADDPGVSLPASAQVEVGLTLVVVALEGSIDLATATLTEIADAVAAFPVGGTGAAAIDLLESGAAALQAEGGGGIASLLGQFLGATP